MKKIIMALMLMSVLLLAGCGNYSDGGCSEGGFMKAVRDPGCVVCETGCTKAGGVFLGFNYAREYGGAFQEHGLEPASCLCRLEGQTVNLYLYDRDIDRIDVYGAISE